MSSRDLARGILLIGGSRAVDVVISLIRVKILAVLLGPTGVGLLGLYNNLQQGAGQVSGLGMITSGVRELSGKAGDASSVGRIRLTLLAAHWVQGLLGAGAVWLARDDLARWLLGDPDMGTEVGLVGIAVLLGVLAQAQTIQLQGLGQVGSFARTTVLASMVGTAAGLAMVLLYGMSGVVWFILAQPLAVVLVSFRYTRRLPAAALSGASAWDLAAIWGRMARLGATMMLGGLCVTGSVLAVRSIIVGESGLDSAGYFAAAWSVSLIYVAFLLEAMTADFYPRLAGLANDRASAIGLINTQVRLGLAIGGPMLLLLIGLAPVLIELLYSSSFGPAVPILQWQAVGSLLKICSWPLIFSLAAFGRPGMFSLAQFSFGAAFVLPVWFLLPRMGIEIAGIAFAAGYAVQFFLLCFLVVRAIDFRWEKRTLQFVTAHFFCSAAVLAVALWDTELGALFGVGATLIAGACSLRLIMSEVRPTGRLGKIASIFATVGWPVKVQK